MDLANAVWTVPENRVKGGHKHRVQLSAACLAILKRARLLNPIGDYVFGGRSPDMPFSNMAFLMALRRMEVAITAHGF